MSYENESIEIIQEYKPQPQIQLDSSDDKCENNIKYNTFRYKLNDYIIELIKEFTSIHKYDDRKTYKEFWNEFCKDNEDVINRETTRLVENGYEGSVTNKMYKAGRYYFIKKSNNNKEQKKRRNYICMDSEVIYSIDEHIKLNINNTQFKPANAYKDYCNNNDILKEEVERLINTYNIDIDTVNNKIKKTYKNRYYIISRNNILNNDSN